MAICRNNGELFTERRGIIDALVISLGKSDHGSRMLRRGRRFGRITKHRLSRWLVLLTALFSIYLTVYGLKMFFQAQIESRFSMPHSLHEERNLQETFVVPDVGRPPKGRRRKQHFPCEVGLLKSVDGLVEPKNYMNSTWFSLEYVDQEEKTFDTGLLESRFGGHQSLEERENSFHAKNQALHCGFVKGSPGHSSVGFDIDEKDKAYMFNCKVVVSSCIFGSSDFLRRPTSRLVFNLA